MAHAIFLGLTTVDIIYEVKRLPELNEKIVAIKHEMHGGGPATNAAITCAFLGGKATLVSAVGEHSLSPIVRNELDSLHVTHIDLSPEAHDPPPISSILVTAETGERAIISAHATRAKIPAEQFDVAVLNQCSLLLVDGHQMECALSAAKLAKTQGVPVVLDGGSWKQGTDELLGFVSYAICSADFHPPGIAGLREMIDYLLQKGSEAVAITRGADPILWATRSGQGEVRVPRVRATDTLGAGDIFHGAFCYYLMNSNSFQEALEQAAKVAAYSCGFFGTRAWMETWPKPGDDPLK